MIKINKILAVLVLAGASVKAQTITQTFGSGADAFSIDFVAIGNPNNPADTTGDPNPVGSVSYVFNLGQYEISRDQVEKANAAGGLGISLFDMTAWGGNGVNRPATGITWNEAARFVNYLNTSQNKQAAYNFDVNGNFQLWEPGLYSGSNQYRHKDAYYFLPSVDEWYKGAYFDPNKVGGAGYWRYSTGSDSAPTAVTGGTVTGTAVYGQATGTGPADVTSAGGLSPYGTMAQDGNVHEWNEDAFDLSNNSAAEDRSGRGGSWNDGGGGLGIFSRGNGDPNGPYPYDGIGFRVASVPEPSSFSLLLAGGAVFAAARRRKVD